MALNGKIGYDDFTSDALLDEWPNEAFFCVSLFKDGSTKKQECKHYSELVQQISSAELSWVNCCVENVHGELPKIVKEFGFTKELGQELLSHKISAYLDMGPELALLLPAVKIRGLHVSVSPIFVLMKGNLILSVHNRRVTRWLKFFNYAEAFFKKIPGKTPQVDKITMMVIRLLDKNNEKNFENLRIIDEAGDRINAMLLDKNVLREKVGAEIYSLKHCLIKYLGVLWASLDVVNSMRYGDSDLITDDAALLKEFASLSTDLINQISLTEHMSEVLASGLEVLQSIYNNQLQILNNRLAWIVAWLTVLGTAVLVPNTIATIFGIPAVSVLIDWQAMTIILIASTLASAMLAYWLLRKTMPTKVD